MTNPNIIVGAGLAGLIAAHAWPRAKVLESRSPGTGPEHRALLRFRSSAVSDLTGIPFRSVTVRKGIWAGGAFVQPNIRLANQYAQKVLPGGLVGERSIWSLEPVERWIAPEQFYFELLENVAARIEWNADFNFTWSANAPEPVISTAPLGVALRALKLAPEFDFRRAPIRVQRFRVPGAAVHQTVYFPDPGLGVYRASITGDLLIVESVMADEDAVAKRYGLGMEYVLNAFGLDRVDPLDQKDQRFGKIAPLPDAERRAALYRLTTEAKIYSLGRFATWRNVLLDDVVQDIAVIKRMLHGDAYAGRKMA